MGISLTLGILCVALAAEEAASKPRSVEETVKSFKLPAGLVIEAVAAEPLVVDPVAITFDEQGRMYAVEYRDYPNGPGEGKPPLSRVKLLEDTNGDGKMDKSYIFADDLSFAQGLMAYRGGLIVSNAPNLLYLKDTDGDHKADVRETLFTGFKPGNPQLRTAHPRWGLDNWIYTTNGLSGGEVASAKKPDHKVNIGGLDFRFNPRTLDYEPATGLGQFGNTFDNWNNRFTCSNRNPTMFSVLPYRAVSRNPFALITKSYEDVAPSGGDAKVYPLVETKTTGFDHTGTHTAACGVTVYRGDLLGPDFLENVFVCEPTAHLVTRSRLTPEGASFRCERTAAKIDFLASDDTWFRPVSLADGPDGALYVVDMYRSVIEHPQYMSQLPKEYVAKLDLRAGDDRGRIYRIRPAKGAIRPFAEPKTTADFVALLADPNGWRRMVGQRVLIERQAKDAIPALEKMAKTGESPLARVHALWTLEGLDALTPAIVQTALADEDAHVQEQAVELAARFLPKDPALVKTLAPLAKSSSPRVRFSVALALGETNEPAANDVLATIAAGDYKDRWITLAVLTSVKERAGAVLAKLLGDSTFTSTGEAERIDLVTKLASVVGARGDQEELASVVGSITGSKAGGAWWQTAALTGLAQGLPRHTGALGKTSLAALLSKPPAKLADSASRLQKRLDQTAQLAVDDKLPVGDRIAAIRLLGYQPFAKSAEVFPQLLQSSQPGAIQQACVEAMQNVNDDRVAPILLANWDSFGPAIRSSALDLLFRKGTTIKALLDAMVQEKISPSVVNLEQRTRLIRSTDKSIQEQAQKLFGGEVSANRRAVVDQYKPALTLASDSTAGHKVFKKICANCHRINGEGHVVGPDINDVRNKTKETLLYDILDPNRAVEPRFTDYVVATADGRLLTGLLAGETADAIVLRRAEGKEDVVPRAEIESIRASGKSVMPEGVEKDLTVQEIADLLQFLKQQK